MIAERSDESNPETIELLKEAAEPHVCNRYSTRISHAICVLYHDDPSPTVYVLYRVI